LYNDLNIEKVTNAYTLFRTYSEYFSIDEHFENYGFNIRRYLEINEEIKESIYKNLSILRNDIERKKDNIKVNRLIKELFDKKVIRCNLFCMFKMDNCYYSSCKKAKLYYNKLSQSGITVDE